MPRAQQSRKRHSSSFIKFVARLQHTLSTKNIKASTPVIQQQLSRQSNPAPLPKFPSFINSNNPRCRLSQILYDPTRQTEYLSEIEKNSNSDTSEQSFAAEDNDSCYDSMSDHHRNDRFNLSQMNVSLDNVVNHRNQPLKLKLPNSLDTARFHSTAIHDMGHF
ncbi:unnamed protein product [Rotaria magnacalcarata]|uniref:Uncharacterized protein n=1 Tax=Rotaria magnacalcarata TaxID=392030 RepID=A0A816NWX3_9BILA|nr:unnamed protein product [Rotaria magnacalcarata]CAF3889202.1 unnamed protein product [Rotaria magnacalcarata]